MKQEKKEEILKWFEKADHDIITAKKSIDYPPIILDAACFHCQQAVEKYLKAYLIYQGNDIKKTHNLNFLREECAEYDSDFEGFNFESLNDFAVEARYPDDFIVPTIEETREFLQIAEDIKKLVMSKIILV